MTTTSHASYLGSRINLSPTDDIFYAILEDALNVVLAGIDDNVMEGVQGIVFDGRSNLALGSILGGVLNVVLTGIVHDVIEGVQGIFLDGRSNLALDFILDVLVDDILDRLVIHPASFIF